MRKPFDNSIVHALSQRPVSPQRRTVERPLQVVADGYGYLPVAVLSQCRSKPVRARMTTDPQHYF